MGRKKKKRNQIKFFQFVWLLLANLDDEIKEVEGGKAEKKLVRSAGFVHSYNRNKKIKQNKIIERERERERDRQTDR